ncbi:glycosyl transferase family group 2-domain-containing protein [Aspergillus californicus]
MAANVKRPRSNRSYLERKLYAVLQYNYIIFPFTHLLTFYLIHQLAYVTGYTVISDDNWNWTTTIHFLLNICFLIGQLPPYASLWGMCLPMQPYENQQAPKSRAFKLLRICLVTKATNFQTVINSTSHWNKLQHPNLRFHVVVDGGSEHVFDKSLPSYVHLDYVPVSFKPQRAMYKARALEFFRRKHKLTPLDWVLHLDEESEINQEVITACLDFIERGDADIGMGTILYNAANHWKNSFLSTAEVIRIADDYGRFQLPVRLFRRPILGWMHGSWILINGAVENKVTWDTACIAEDFWFAYQAASLGCKFGWLHAIVREQPPCTLGDFLKQRRRWYTGIFSIGGITVRASLVASVMGVACFFLTPFFRVFGQNVAFPPWYSYWTLFNQTTEIHALLVASVIQDMTMPDISWVAVVLHALEVILLAPFVHLMQAAAMVSCLFAPSRGFNVVKKI